MFAIGILVLFAGLAVIPPFMQLAMGCNERGERVAVGARWYWQALAVVGYFAWQVAVLALTGPAIVKLLA